MTNYEIQGHVKKKFRVGERLKCPIDKVHRFLSYFIQRKKRLNVPVIDGYNNEQSVNVENESRHTLSRKQTSRLVLILDFKEKSVQKMATLKDNSKTARSKLSRGESIMSSPRQRKIKT